MAATYDPKKIDLIINGVRMDGYGDGTFITITQNVDTYTHAKGADGLGAFARSNNNSATISIVLMPNSQGNDVLSGFFEAQALGVPMGGALIDRNGRTVGTGAGLKIARLPDVTYSAGGVEFRTWTIIADTWASFVGGADAS